VEPDFIKNIALGEKPRNYIGKPDPGDSRYIFIKFFRANPSKLHNTVKENCKGSGGM
jgi:hypothetical protein